VLAAAAAGLLPPLAAAQTLTDVARPPAPMTADKPPIIRTYLVAALLGGGILLASLIPSKRGHQD
jgi:hypothetical protein